MSEHALARDRVLPLPGRERHHRHRAGGGARPARPPRARDRQRAPIPRAARLRAPVLPRSRGVQLPAARPRRPTRWRWRSSLVEIAQDHGLDLVHVHYAVPHATSAYLARQVLGAAAPRVVTTLHGTDVTHLGSDPSYRADHALRGRAVRRGHRPLGVPEGRDLPAPGRARRHARSRSSPTSSTPSISRRPRSRDRGRFDEVFAAAGGDPGDRGAPVLFHVSSFRAVKRVTDLVDVLAGVRQHMPRASDAGGRRARASPPHAAGAGAGRGPERLPPGTTRRFRGLPPARRRLPAAQRERELRRRRARGAVAAAFRSSPTAWAVSPRW